MQYIETGEIVSLHGIKGEVKIYPWTDYPEFLEEFSEFYIQKNKMHYQKLLAQEVRTHKNMSIVKFEGFDTVELARTLIGKTVYVDREEIELEEGQYFIQDLISCKVLNADNEQEIGILENVENHGASDIYSIVDKAGKTHLFPAVEEFIISTDTSAKIIKIKVIEGMFSED